MRTGTTFRSENQIFNHAFLSNGVCYETDFWDSGRYYRLEESRSLRREMDGAMVRRRISRSAYEEALQNCERRIAEHEAWVLSVGGVL